MTTVNSNPALNGLKVLDLSRILAGPWSSQTLADLGAEVIKVEHPIKGDDTRHWGPPYWQDNSLMSDEDFSTPHLTDKNLSAYFMACNRNKESLAVDISTTEGQAIIHQLVADSDIVIENFKKDKLKEYHLDYDSLKAIKSDIIYCSITGFGQTGPKSDDAGYDLMIQAMSGLMSITGKSDDELGGGPVKVGVALIDVMTGLYATIGILAAVNHRNNTGEGQSIDMSLLDVSMATLANQASNYLVSGTVPKRLGGAHPNIVPYQNFKASDGYWILAVGNDSQFASFCQVANLTELSQDNRFSDNKNRVKHRDQLIAILEEVIEKKPRQWWISELTQKGVPCGPINTIKEAFEEPQAKARGLSMTIKNSKQQDMPIVAQPIKLSKSPIVYKYAPPTLGEHTQRILSDRLGFTEAEIEALSSKGIVSN